MNYINDFTGCRVLINHAKTQNNLTDSTIVSYDKANVVITVESVSLKNYVDEKVSVLIFAKGSLYEFGGTIRRCYPNGSTEIALFKGKAKEDRTYQRYSIKTKGKITFIKENEKVLTLGRPIEIEVENISATGIFFRTWTQAAANLLKINNQLRLSIEVNENAMDIECFIIREKNISNKEVEFGCQFLEVQKRN